MEDFDLDVKDTKATKSEQKLQERLTQEYVEEVCCKTGLNRADFLLQELGNLSYMQGACEDWPDIRDICRHAFRELLDVIPYKTAYYLVRNVVIFYDKNVIRVERPIPRRKRLAYFLAKLICEMKACKPYMDAFSAEVLDCDPNVESDIVTGLLLERLKSVNALEICGEFFQREILRTDLYVQRKAEKKRLAEEARLYVKMHLLQPEITAA